MTGSWFSGWSLFVLTMIGALYGSYRHGVSVNELAWEAKWEREIGRQAIATAGVLAENRNEEQRRLVAANQVASDARKLQVNAVDDGVAADVVGDRLRTAAAELAADANSCPGNTSAAGRGAASTRAAMVLSDLLRRADSRAGELAKAYDAARIAGQACEQTYAELASTVPRNVAN